MLGGVLLSNGSTEVSNVVSKHKLLANRRNAKRSTGPKDTRRTKYNAQKHGLLSKAAIIQTGDAKEDPRELESLLEELRRDLQPEGEMEEILVDCIASRYWRLRRAQRAEVGAIHEEVELMGSLQPLVALPNDNVLAKILRYEVAIDRLMHRALKELRELQAARRVRSTLLGATDNGV